MAEKILAAHAGRAKVEPGELVRAKLDLVLGNDITAPLAIREFRSLGAEAVFDAERVVLVADHFTPNKDIKTAELVREMRAFAHENGIVHFYEGGEAGVEHALLPEKGLVGPGDLVIGADSHTCTYGALGAFATGVGSTDLAVGMATGTAWFRVPDTFRVVLGGAPRRFVTGKDVILALIGGIGVEGANYQALEFTGEGLASLSVESRLTIGNMAIEAGAKAGLMPPDEAVLAYVEGRAVRPYEIFLSDPDAHYRETLEIDLASLELQVAFPHLPENTRPISQVGDVPVNQVVIGSCTNGRMEDLRLAAGILKGKRVAGGLRAIVIPATPAIYLEALREGLLETFVTAGAMVSVPTCGPCLGGHMGVLAEGERALSTTNRNFPGRMGHPKSEVYLAGPAVAAATAILGRIGSPEEVL